MSHILKRKPTAIFLEFVTYVDISSETIFFVVENWHSIKVVIKKNPSMTVEMLLISELALRISKGFIVFYLLYF